MGISGHTEIVETFNKMMPSAVMQTCRPQRDKEGKLGNYNLAFGHRRTRDETLSAGALLRIRLELELEICGYGKERFQETYHIQHACARYPGQASGMGVYRGSAELMTIYGKGWNIPSLQPLIYGKKRRH